VPASERFAADLIDLLIALPIAAALLFGLPRLILLDDAPPGSDENAYAAAGAFMLMIPLCVPLAAMIYTGLAYLIMRNTSGKHLKSLTLQREGGGPASRRRIALRCLFKWGLFTGIIWSGLIVEAMLVVFGVEGTVLSGLASLSSIVIAFLVLIGILIADRLLPLTRPDARSLTDIVTGTEVKWRTQAFQSQTS
jgi:hypothetical protein